MCLRPSHLIHPERPIIAPFGPEWNWEMQQQNQHRQQQFVLNHQRNSSMDHLLKIKFHPDYRSSIEQKMFGTFASVFECSFLFVATISALFSIVQPKMKNGLLMLALPLCAIIPAVTGANVGKEEAEEMDGANN